MQLEEIKIKNFGVFRQQNTVNLTPSKDKPIILIGGLNGSGKTTLLDAIQLALYGKRANISNRGSLSYEEYLLRSVNKQAKEEKAVITLTFKQFTDEAEQKFTVERSWKRKKKSIIENVTVYRNGDLDRVLTDTWTEYVEEILPVKISQLFFFDGEKIESFASYENSSELVSRAIHSLLGLDLVNSLSADLITLERNKKLSLKSSDEKRNIEELKNVIAQIDEEIEDYSMERASAQSSVDRNQKKLSEAERNYSKKGGSLFDQSDEIEKSLEKIREELSILHDRMLILSEEDLPFLIVSDLLTQIDKQNRREKKTIEFDLVKNVLKERDTGLLTFLKSNQICSDGLRKVAAFLETDRAEREELESNQIQYLNLSTQTQQDLSALLNSLQIPQNKAIELLTEADKLQSQIIDLERKLAGVPKQDLVIKLVQERDEAKVMLSQSEEHLSDIDEKIKFLTLRREEQHTKLIRILEKDVQEGFEREDLSRIIQHAEIVRDKLDEFRETLISQHVNRIASLILDSFQNLLRKQSLVSDIEIDTENFVLEIHDTNRQILPPERLSAGERQLLAVSMIWGLARASGQPLPVIIDTPLGRLDTSHRQKLIKDYFPKASHQVILLSTDEEIDEQSYKNLEKYIERSYHLEYSDKDSSTQVKEDYFW